MAASGKLDKKALPPIDLKGDTTEVEADGLAKTQTEKKLVPLWAEVLQLKSTSIDIHESFFDLGGYVLYTWIVDLFCKIFSESTI